MFHYLTLHKEVLRDDADGSDCIASPIEHPLAQNCLYLPGCLGPVLTLLQRYLDVEGKYGQVLADWKLKPVKFGRVAAVLETQRQELIELTRALTVGSCPSRRTLRAGVGWRLVLSSPWLPNLLIMQHCKDPVQQSRL